MSKKQSWALATVVSAALGFVAFGWIQDVLRLDTDVRRILAVGFGLAALAIGAAIALYWTTRPVENANLRRLGIVWGLGGAAGGLVALLWVARLEAAVIAASIIALALWILGRIQLRNVRRGHSRSEGPDRSDVEQA